MTKKTLNLRSTLLCLFFVFAFSTLTFSQTITSFSPTTISAGTGSLLTVNGTGFGTNPGSVWTRWSGHNNNNSWIGSTEVVSWTNTKIVVRVTESAGSGQIAVYLNGNFYVSPTALTVKYAIFTSPWGSPLILTNNNGNGGYTFQMENNFAANTAANASFRRAFANWVCSTNVNWNIGANTAVNTSAKDGVNVVKFGGASDILVGTLAYTAIGFQLCPSGEFELIDVDMTFNKDYNWNYTNSAPAANQYDFESVALHELGHAHGLVHVNNAGDVMYHTTAVGTTNRGLSASAVEGGSYMLSNSRLTTSTCYGPIVPFSPGYCPQIPAITTFSPSSAARGSLVTITGANFTNATRVAFGDVPAASFTVVSSTTITAEVANGGATGDVSVVSPNGVAAAAGFTFLTTLPQTLSYLQFPVKTFGDIDFDPAVTANTGLPITYSTSNGAVATIVNNKVHIVGAGTAIITASQAGNVTYAAASVNLTLNVNKASQSISFPAIPVKLTSSPDFDLNAVASSGLIVNYASSNPAVLTITNGRVHILGTGTTTITAIQNGDNNYNAASNISVELTVSNLPQIITFTEITDKKVNDADFEAGATVNSGLPITYTSSNLNVATIVNNKIHITGAGTSIITASQPGNLTYASASAQVVLTVSKLLQIITLPNLAAKDVNIADFDPGATVNSGLQITYTSSNLNVATIVNNKIHIVGAGATTITATQAGDATYTAVTTSVNLTINKLIQSINLPQIAIKTFNDADFDLNATVTSGLALSYSSSNTNVATIVNNKVHIVGTGTASITATQAGNATYDATSSSVTLTVNKLQQTITFPQIALKNHTDADFDLNATSSSGLAVTYSSSNAAVATIVAGKLHIVAGGAALITASQAGNSNIIAAPDVIQNLDVLFNIPISNFTVKATDETCKASNNGAINITATQILSYTATVTVNGTQKTYSFNSVLAVNNLDAGTYNVCITVAGQPTYKQCFDIIVKEPKDLAVYSSIKDAGNSVVLKLEGGERYIIDLNGELISTTSQEITLPLAKGNNIVKIASDKTCQGVITRTFSTSNTISLYPNPVKNILNIVTGNNAASSVKVEIHGLDGRLIQSTQHIAEYGQIGIDVSKLNKGLYVLTLTIGNSKTVHKVIKE